MNGEITRSKAIKIGENDTWSHSWMSRWLIKKGPVSERRRAFFFGHVPLFRTAPFKEAEAFEELRLVAETAS
jgi:hypothetical protein